LLFIGFSCICKAQSVTINVLCYLFLSQILVLLSPSKPVLAEQVVELVVIAVVIEV